MWELSNVFLQRICYTRMHDYYNADDDDDMILILIQQQQQQQREHKQLLENVDNLP
jgi:hypothetical protein